MIIVVVVIVRLTILWIIIVMTDFSVTDANTIVNDLYFLWESMLNLLLVLHSNYKYTRTRANNHNNNYDASYHDDCAGFK